MASRVSSLFHREAVSCRRYRAYPTRKDFAMLVRVDQALDCHTIPARDAAERDGDWREDEVLRKRGEGAIACISHDLDNHCPARLDCRNQDDFVKCRSRPGAIGYRSRGSSVVDRCHGTRDVVHAASSSLEGRSSEIAGSGVNGDGSFRIRSISL
jgi:hypothetical protein